MLRGCLGAPFYTGRRVAAARGCSRAPLGGPITYEMRPSYCKSLAPRRSPAFGSLSLSFPLAPARISLEYLSNSPRPPPVSPFAPLPFLLEKIFSPARRRRHLLHLTRLTRLPTSSSYIPLLPYSPPHFIRLDEFHFPFSLRFINSFPFPFPV